MPYEQRRLEYVSSRAVYDLSSGIPLDSNDCVSLCMPRTGWFIARSLLEAYGRREVQYSSFYDNNGYVNLSPEDWQAIQEIIGATLGACPVNCSEIVDALNGISLAIGASTCGGAGMAGEQTETPDPFVETGSNFPPGFTDLTDFELWKCQRANIIVSAWKLDLSVLKDLDVGGFAVAFLIGALVTPIPVDDVIALLALVVGLFGEALLDTTITEIETFIAANSEELVCAMFEADSAQSAKDAVISVYAPGLSWPATMLLTFMWSFTNVNSLFIKTAFAALVPNTVNIDCTVCAPPPCATIFLQFGIDNGDDTYSSVLVGGDQGIVVWVNTTGTDTCLDTTGPETQLLLTQTAGLPLSIPGDGEHQVFWYPVNCTSAVEKYRGETMWPPGTTARFFQLFSDTSFTFRNDCPPP